MASNVYLKSQVPAASAPPARPEPGLPVRTKLLLYLREIKRNIALISRSQADYKSTNDAEAERQIRSKVSLCFGEINKAAGGAQHLIRAIKQDLAERKHIFNDPNSEDTNTRFLETTVAAAELQLFAMIKQFNKSQIEIKMLFKDKMYRQILIYDPHAEKERVTELLGDPAVG